MTATPRPARRARRLGTLLLVVLATTACGRDAPSPQASGTTPTSFGGLTLLEATDVCVAYGRQHLPDHAFITASGAAATSAKDRRSPDGTFLCTFAPPTPKDPCDAVDPTACARTTVLLDRTGTVRQYMAAGS